MDARQPPDEALVAFASALGRIGQPADIADVVAFLASGGARWVTGHLLDASEGMFPGPRMSVTPSQTSPAT